MTCRSAPARTAPVRPAGRPAPVPRWVPVLFAVLSVALIPGITRLLETASPPRLAMHWRLAWTGFDIALAVLLVATGLALRRRSGYAQVLASMTAALLCCDAWTDVLTSGGTSRAVAVAEAAIIELPLAVVFGLMAVRTARDSAASEHARDPTATQPRSAPRLPHELPGWLPVVCVALGAALLPWSLWLFATLPPATRTRDWRLASAGLELALALTLAADAVALIRRWATTPVIVTMAAALLLRDAWFNVLTARPGRAAMAIAVAGGLELPLAGLCLLVAITHIQRSADAGPWGRRCQPAALEQAGPGDRPLCLPDEAARAGRR